MKKNRSSSRVEKSLRNASVRPAPKPRRAPVSPGTAWTAVSRPRVTAQVVDAVAQLLDLVLRFDGPADAIMARFFRGQQTLGVRDRAMVAQACFDALRRLSSLSWLMQPAQPERAPRLAALVVLARQHGWTALDARTLRGDATAVRQAMARDARLNEAPPEVHAELPAWLYERLQAQYEDADALIAANTQSAPLDLRVNVLKADRATVIEELRQLRHGAHALEPQATAYSPEGIRLEEKVALMRWPVYQQGRVEVQDEGSQLVARLLAPRRGQMVVDFCAGAGGKTLALGALMRSTGRLYALDINAKRLAGLVPRMRRSGLSNVHPIAIQSESDIRIKRLAGKIDAVLVDAPCSGSGTLRRNPDLKWRFDDRELARLGAVQASVLRAAARLLKPGGRLVYATCSLLEAENQHVIEAFLQERPEFASVSAAAVLAAQGIVLPHTQRFAPWFIMLPHLHQTDGFFAAVLERRA